VVLCGMVWYPRSIQFIHVGRSHLGLTWPCSALEEQRPRPRERASYTDSGSASNFGAILENRFHHAVRREGTGAEVI
jgi:hypothetical protein